MDSSNCIFQGLHKTDNEITKNYENRTLIISSYDISLFKGFDARIIQKIKQKINVSKLPIIIDKTLKKNSFSFTNKIAEHYW